MVCLTATEGPNLSLIATFLEKLRKSLISKFASEKTLIKRVLGLLFRTIRKRISKRTPHPTCIAKHKHHGV